jgi:hypothetical protein
MMIKQKIKIRNTQSCPERSRRDAIRNTNKGAALLVVLFVIMAITILSLGFLSRSDVELACGQNMILRTQMDYLAESGLEHAKGLILNPQDIVEDLEDWEATKQQLVQGSSDYYDVHIVRDNNEPNNYCNYIIDCNACRMKDGQEMGRSSLLAYLRLDPCIALWTGTDTTLWSGVTVNGDVRCAGTLINQGRIGGDVFANTLTGAGTKDGQKYNPADLSLSWPGVTVIDFKDKPGVNYYLGSYTLSGNESINGMLLVDGDLTVSGVNNIIVAGKNLPALYVTGDLILEKDAILDVNGLAVVEKRVLINGDARLKVLGGLFIRETLKETTMDSSGKGNIGILYGPTPYVDGGHNALRFDGIDDYVQTPNNATKLQVTGDYTLSVWIKPNTSQNIWAGIVSKTNSDGTINHWTLQFDSSNPRNLVVYHPDSYPNPKWNTGITLNDLPSNAWHHIVIVRNDSNMTSYINHTCRKVEIWSTPPGNGYGHLNIGVDRTGASSYVYGGLIDDVRIYNRALSASEVSSPPNDASLIGYWKFDEANPNVTITAAPEKTAILHWSEQGVEQKWGQAAGAFFRSIRRN